VKLDGQQTDYNLECAKQPSSAIIIMSDSDEAPKKAGVPSWQLKPKEYSKKEAEEPVPETPSRGSVIEQAKKFLEEDEVRDAPTDKKIAFLESKGLQSDEIEGLLGITRNAEATATAAEVCSPFLLILTAFSPQLCPPFPCLLG